MSLRAVAWVAAAITILTYTTALVFLAFDRGSNSASDTVRPTVITMAPIWGLAIAAGLALRRDRKG